MLSTPMLLCIYLHKYTYASKYGNIKHRDKMGAILGFFTGPLGKIAMYLIGAIFAALGIWAGWAHYDGMRDQISSLKAANAQYQQVVVDQKEFIKHQDALMVFQSQSITSFAKKTEDTVKQYTTVNDYLNSKEAVANDRPSSDILKETVRKLGVIK
jgi:hypothetical protein